MIGSTIYNMVLVKPDANFTSYLKDGKDTGIASGFSAESAGQRLSVRGVVVKAPKKLVYNGEAMHTSRKNFSNDTASLAKIGDLRSASILFDVDIEVEEGDIVYFNYMEHYECYQKGAYIETDNGDLLLMTYDSLILAHKPDKFETLKTLNGLVLMEVLPEEKRDEIISVITLKKYQNKVGKLGSGKVLLTGSLCRGYMEDLSVPTDKDEVKSGDTILYKPLGAHLLEWGLHQTAFPGKTVMAIHRRHILYTE